MNLHRLGIHASISWVKHRRVSMFFSQPTRLWTIPSRALADGLTFVHVISALYERQGHDVHRGTVRTLLYAGGFVQRNGLWFAAPQNEVGAHKLREALVETLVAVEGGGDDGEESTECERQLRRVRAIRGSW
jgi:hypothetical protein